MRKTIKIETICDELISMEKRSAELGKTWLESHNENTWTAYTSLNSKELAIIELLESITGLCVCPTQNAVIFYKEDGSDYIDIYTYTAK